MDWWPYIVGSVLVPVLVQMLRSWKVADTYKTAAALGVSVLVTIAGMAIAGEIESWTQFMQSLSVVFAGATVFYRGVFKPAMEKGMSKIIAPPLVLLVAISMMGCSVSWNTVEEGAIRCYLGTEGEMKTLDESAKLGVPEEPYPAEMGAIPKGTWIDISVVQGSEAASKADTKASASVAATGQGQATGGEAGITATETETSTDTTETGNTAEASADDG